MAGNGLRGHLPIFPLFLPTPHPAVRHGGGYVIRTMTQVRLLSINDLGGIGGFGRLPSHTPKFHTFVGCQRRPSGGMAADR
jgi:hypothetical protein